MPAPSISKLRLASWRDLRRHLSQTLLTVLGVALGVAVLVAVELANESARRAFDLSMSTLSGKATHQLVAGEAGLDEGLYAELRRQRVRPSTPVIEGLVRIDGETFRLFGIDPLSGGELRPVGGDLPEGDLRALLTRPGTVLFGERDLHRLGREIGDGLELDVAGAGHRVEIAGRLTYANPVALEGLIFADIATAQELLDRIGRIDRIDLILDAGQRARVEGLLPDGVRLLGN